MQAQRLRCYRVQVGWSDGTLTASFHGVPRWPRQMKYLQLGDWLMSFILVSPLFAAAGWSLLYLLCGGGLVGAIILFFVLKSVGA